MFTCHNEEKIRNVYSRVLLPGTMLRVKFCCDFSGIVVDLSRPAIQITRITVGYRYHRHYVYICTD